MQTNWQPCFQITVTEDEDECMKWLAKTFHFKLPIVSSDTKHDLLFASHSMLVLEDGIFQSAFDWTKICVVREQNVNYVFLIIYFNNFISTKS